MFDALSNAIAKDQNREQEKRAELRDKVAQRFAEGPNAELDKEIESLRVWVGMSKREFARLCLEIAG